ncbi:MAG TPA: transglycosylase domain-containing protein, partial [Acidimicrobiales bacterium]
PHGPGTATGTGTGTGTANGAPLVPNPRARPAPPGTPPPPASVGARRAASVAAGQRVSSGRPLARGATGGGNRAATFFAGGSRSRARRKQGRKNSFLWRYRRVWFLFGVIVVTALAGAAWVLTQVPLPPEAALPQTTIIYDAAGNQLATLHGQENRFPIKLDQVPQVVQDAVVAAEDRKFFQHGGIDPLGIIRATWADVRKKGATQGGSTITQQYVKQVYVGSDPTLWRKLREAVIAIKLERKLDKRQILERYLNTVYFGRGAYGIQAASRTWFDMDVNQLGLREAAYLVGLIRSPSGGDLASDPALAYELRTFVLQAMVETKAITPAQQAEVEAIKLEDYVAPRTELDSTIAMPGVGAEYYVQYVRQQLEELYSEDFVLRQGLRVRTTLDPELQRQAYDAVYGLLDQEGDPAGALVAINQDGQVVAMVGGRDWEQSEVNLAVGDEGGGSGRQGGSTFKPFALAEAVREGYSLESSFRGPAKIVLPKADRGNDWEVTNYESAGYGQVNLIDATVNSVNTVYAQLVDALGPDKVVDMAEQLGITSELAPVASIALGTQNVSVLEMANAYSTLARGGVRYEPQVITEVSVNDTVLPDTRAKGVRVLEKAQADQVNFALEQVVTRGSGTAAQVRNTKIKGKTGTTEDFGDAWFIGSTRSLTVAVWMGYPEGQSQQLLNIHGVKKVNGGSLPAKIFQRFVSGLAPENDDSPTPAPDFEGKALSPIVRYTTPTVPEPEPTPTSVPDNSVTLSGPTTTVAELPTGGAPGGDATTNGDNSSTANVDSQATVDTTPEPQIRPRRDPNAPIITLPPGVTIPGG